MKFVKIYEILPEEMQHLFDLNKQVVMLTPRYIIMFLICCYL